MLANRGGYAAISLLLRMGTNRLLPVQIHSRMLSLSHPPSVIPSSNPVELHTIFTESVLADLRPNNFEHILRPYESIISNVESCRKLDATLKNSTLSLIVRRSFWILLLSAARDQSLDELAASIIEYVCTAPDNHSSSTLLVAMTGLAERGLFEEFTLLYTELNSKLSQQDRLVYSQKLINVLALTPFWKDALPLLEKLPPSHTPLCCSALFEAAATFGFPSDVFNLFQKFLDQSFTLSDNFFRLFFQNESCDLQETFRLFQALHHSGQILSKPSAALIVQWFTSHSIKGWKATSGQQIFGLTCSSCGSNLPKSSFSKADCDRMANEFYQRAFEGSREEDLYLTTTPQELSAFKNFLSTQKAPFDCVIDLANVLFTSWLARSPTKAGSRLAVVLQYLHREFNLTRFCLVSKPLSIARSNLFWQPIKSLGDRSGISVYNFSTNTKSDDDVFMIYMALWSGPHCHLVSGDKFRQHRFTVGTEIGHMLYRWQTMRQISVKLGVSPTYDLPVNYEYRVHGDADHGWHLPYEDKDTPVGSSYMWICISHVQ